MQTIAAVVITKNEERNIGDCLESARWADELVVVDAESRDRTVDIARKYTDKVFIRPWPGFGPQWNYGLDKATTEWVFVLAADERIPTALKEEILTVIADGPPADVGGYEVPRRNFFYGRWIRHAGFYPDYGLRLFRRAAGRYNDVLFHENLILRGRVARLANPLDHYSMPGIQEHVQKMIRYTTLGAEEKLKRRSRITMLDVAGNHLVTALKTYFLRKGCLDGVPGLIVSGFAGMHTFVKYAKAWEQLSVGGGERSRSDNLDRIPMNVPFLDLPGQYQAIRKVVEERLAQIFRDASFILGPSVKEFEEAFGRFLGTGEVVGVANGTDALILALKAIGIRPGDEVITAANSFVATAEAIAHTGARPVFVDVDSSTYTMNVALIPDAITKRTKAIVPVHLYGQPADLDAVLALARAGGLQVVEDAAQAHGAAYRGKPVGTVAEAGCFSFYPGKNLGACGDAGAVVTTDKAVAETVRKLRDHGGTRKYQHDLIGYNSRLDSLQAAVLLVKLRYLDQWNALRQEHAQLYSKLLSGIPGITTPTIRAGCTHVFHLFVIRVSGGKRDALQNYLRQEGIATGIHYPTSLHLTPAFRYLGYRVGNFPVAEACANEVLSLPMFPELTPLQIEYVADRIRHFMEAKT